LISIFVQKFEDHLVLLRRKNSPKQSKDKTPTVLFHGLNNNKEKENNATSLP